MAFLDNSGDIILDAVLTDTGRARLAKGDGSFKITKFALGDDEIDYALYDKDHPSGSAYYDLSILQSPILEAFTNNGSTMKSKLISIPRTNILYLPVIKPNQVQTAYQSFNNSGSWYIAVDQNTVGTKANPGLIVGAAGTSAPAGILNGFNPASNVGGASIRTDQGLDTNELPVTLALDADLVETQYIVEIDNRLGYVVDQQGSSQAYSYLDDDNIASYNITNAGQTTAFFASLGTEPNDSSIQGPRGVAFRFRFIPSLELQSSTYLFQTIGTTGTTFSGDSTFAFIDTIVKVTGATTGYSIDIPLRYLKKTA